MSKFHLYQYQIISYIFILEFSSMRASLYGNICIDDVYVMCIQTGLKLEFYQNSGILEEGHVSLVSTGLSLNSIYQSHINFDWIGFVVTLIPLKERINLKHCFTYLKNKKL